MTGFTIGHSGWPETDPDCPACGGYGRIEIEGPGTFNSANCPTCHTPEVREAKQRRLEELKAAEQVHCSAALLAVDIGRSGALALFDDAGQLLDVEDMPVLADGPAGRPTVNGPLLAAIVGRWKPASAVVEHVAARPGEAAPGSFAFGRSRGVVEGVLAAQGIPARHVTPAWWKRRAGIPPGREHKDLARSIAIAKWPERAELFARVKDHDRAEACLIGLAIINERPAGRIPAEITGGSKCVGGG